MVHAELEERVRDRQRPAPLRLPPPAAVIAALTLAATSVAPARAQTITEHYVLFPAGHQPASPKNEASFSGSSSSTYQVKAALNSGPILPLSDFLVDATFLDGNTRVRFSPQSVSPAAFAAVYTSGALGTDATLDAGIFEGDTPINRLLTIRVRYDASARFTDAQSIGDLRWGTPRIEIYEGATVDPALAFAWSGYGTGTRNWTTSDPDTAYTCRVGGDSVSFSTWPSSPGEDSTLFQATPASTSTSSGNGRLNLTAAPDYENPTDSGGDNLYKVRVRSGHNLNAIGGEGQRSGCNGSALELTVVVKDAGPPAPVRSLTGSLDSDTGILSVNWAPPAGFLDGSDSSVVVPFDTARRSGSGAAGTAVAGYDVEYRLHGGSTWTQATTTTTSFEISGVGAGDAYTVRVRARNAEGTGAPATIDVPRPPEPPKPPEPPEPPPNLRPRVSVSCDPCTVAPGGEVQLTARASDPDGDDLTYEWSTPEGVLGEETDAATARWTAPEATGRVRFRVRVSDEHGASASATVIVEVANEPPAFESSEYAFELAENIDGSRRPVALGEVAATDLDGDELTYELASGDRSRFEVGARDGALRYIGPGEDFESEAKRYELTVRVRDPYGAEAEVGVAVTITNMNEPPQANDDEAATDEDQAVTVDVLANDSDPDGDGLRVASLSAPAHGATAVTGGAVRYTPAVNYHGVDRFTYVVADGNGATAEAAVEVTVRAVNDSPVAVGVIPDQALDEGGDAATVELTPFFEDIDGDALAYRASSSDPSVAAAAVTGAVLTLAPADYGSAAVTVTAEDEGGLTATQTFAVGVSDRFVRGVVRDTLAGMARSHLASARMTLGRRVTAGRAEGSRLTLLGRGIPLGQAAARAAGEQMLAGWLSSWTTPYGGPAGRPRFGAGGGGSGVPAARGPATGGMPAAAGLHGVAAAGRGGVAGVTGGAGGFGSFGGLGGFGGGADPLRGSEFLLSLGGGQDADEGRGAGRRWQVWGQGDVQAFQGEPSAAAGYDGSLLTGYAGVDTWVTERWLAGLAVARSRGRGDWRAGGSQGALATTLTAVHPYVQWADGATSVWATAGGGWGAAENVRRSGRRGASGLGLRLGLVELRRRLGAAAGGWRFGVRADGAWAQLRTAAGEESIDDQTAAVNQVRVGAEVSRPLRLGGVSLAPFGEAHVRRDGGAGQPGGGLEVAGGLRAAAGRVRVDAQGRVLAVHSAAGYRERGVGVTLSVGNQDQEGLSLSVSPRWGDSAIGGGALWQDQVQRRYLPEAEPDEWVLDARSAYGLRLASGRLVTWFGSLSHSPFGRRFLVGGSVGVLD